MISGQARLRVALVLGGLVLAHFTVRPAFGNLRGGPDFMLLALMLFAIRARPGDAAIAGFIVGLLADARAEAVFGAGALAHTVLGYLLGWGKAVFFPDNMVVNMGFLFAGAWVRDLLVLLAGGQLSLSALAWQLGTWSLLQAFTTAATGVGVLVVFRRWMTIGTAI